MPRHYVIRYRGAPYAAGEPGHDEYVTTRAQQVVGRWTGYGPLQRRERTLLVIEPDGRERPLGVECGRDWWELAIDEGEGGREVIARHAPQGAGRAEP